MMLTWENEFGTVPRTNAERSLTRSLDLREEGLAMQATRTCSVTDCDAPHFGQGWCSRHYTRWRRTGDPLGFRRPLERPACSIGDCERRSRRRTWCAMHYERWLNTGDPLKVRPMVITPPGPAHPSWRGADITYASAHRRITNVKGPASDHACVNCGHSAAEWSYDHRDPDEVSRPGRRTSPFSLKPEHYEARCVRCHRRFDKGLDV